MPPIKRCARWTSTVQSTHDVVRFAVFRLSCRTMTKKQLRMGESGLLNDVGKEHEGPKRQVVPPESSG